MTAKTRTILPAVALILAAAAACTTLWLGSGLADEVGRAEQTRCETLRFIDALRQSTDDLTGLARAYAATGDIRFVDYYRWEHGVRDGSVGRPVDSWRVYWDLVAAGQDHPRPDGEPLSILDQAAQHPFTNEEREIIAGVLETAAELKAVEEESIEFRTGAFEEIDGRMRAVQTPDPMVATALLYDPPYLELRAACLTAIDILQGLVETRSGEELVALRDRRHGYGSAATALMVLAGLLAVLVLATAGGRGGERSPPR